MKTAGRGFAFTPLSADLKGRATDEGAGEWGSRAAAGGGGGALAATGPRQINDGGLLRKTKLLGKLPTPERTVKIYECAHK
jgi:hypothetical protein